MAALTLMELSLAQNKEEAFSKIQQVIESGKALEYVKKLVESQGGNTAVIDNYRFFPQPNYAFQLKAESDGFVQNIDAYKTAYACKLLGAGREKKTDAIDYSAGIYLNKIFGEKVVCGDVIATLYANDPDKLETSREFLKTAFSISNEEPHRDSLIYKII